MDGKIILENLKKIRNSENNAKMLKKSVNNDIASIRLSMDEGIENGVDVEELRKLRNERTNKESYSKSLNSEIHKLNAAFDDVLYERGDYDPSQITFFDAEESKEEVSENEEDDFFEPEPEPEMVEETGTE